MGRPPSPHQVQPILHMTLRSRFFIQRFFPEKINGIPNLWDYSWMIMPSGKSIKFQPDILRKGNFLKSYYNFSRECNIIKRVFAIVKLKLILWILYCTDHYWIRWMKDQSSWLCPDKLRERRATQQSRDFNLAIILVSTVVMFFLCHLPRVVTRSSSFIMNVVIITIILIIVIIVIMIVIIIITILVSTIIMGVPNFFFNFYLVMGL